METTQLLRDLENLSLSHKSAIDSKASEPDYVVDVAVQTGARDGLIAAASSNFSIHLMSKDSLKTSATLKGHKGAITKVQFCKSDPNILYSTSKDGTCQCWDVRTSKQVKSFEVPPDCGELLSLAVSPSGRLVCAGTEKVKHDSYLLFWDSRQMSVLGGYSESHQDGITQLSFQPGSDRHLASGTSDGFVSLFDLTETSEDDSLQTTFSADSDVSKLGWCGTDYSCVYAVTTDSSFNVWDATDEATQGEPLCSVQSLADLQEKNTSSPVDYILDCIPDLTAADKTRSSAILLAGTYSGDLRMISLSESGTPSTVCSLREGHTAPLRCCYWDTQEKQLLTGAEDSLVCLWTVGAALPLGHSLEDKVKGKVKSKASISPAGKKPYNRPTKK